MKWQSYLSYLIRQGVSTHMWVCSTGLCVHGGALSPIVYDFAFLIHRLQIAAQLVSYSNTFEPAMSQHQCNHSISRRCSQKFQVCPTCSINMTSTYHTRCRLLQHRICIWNCFDSEWLPDDVRLAGTLLFPTLGHHWTRPRLLR